MKLLIQLPVRQRPDALIRSIEDYRRMADDESHEICVVGDEDDRTMDSPEIRKFLLEQEAVSVVFLKSSDKISAVNGILGRKVWDVVLVASDDMVPVRRGYDSVIISRMRENFPDLDGVLWFDDGYQRDRLNTLPVLGRKYWARFGYVYCPEYQSMYADNEFMQVAENLGRQKYFPEVIIEHRHPDAGKAKNDALYKRNQRRQGRDHSVYRRRKAAGFSAPNKG